MKKLGILIFAALTICFSVAGASEQPSGQTAASVNLIDIAGVGRFTVPQNIKCTNAVGADAKNLADQYDLNNQSKDGMRYARFVVYQDSHDLGMATTLINMVAEKPELIPVMAEMGKSFIVKKMEENGAKLVEWLPAGKATVQKHSGIQLGARFILSEKFPVTVYTTFAVYSLENKLTGVALMCPDSERSFWQPVFEQIIKSE